MTIDQLIHLLKLAKSKSKMGGNTKVVLWNSSNPLMDIELSDRNLIEKVNLVSFNGTKIELEVENSKG